MQQLAILPKSEIELLPRRLMWLPDHRLLRMITGAAIWSISLCSFGQSAPWSMFFPPSLPTSPQECRAYSAEVEKYAQQVYEAHAKCLDSHGMDRQNEPPNSRICSRSSCQYLHDLLYESGMFSPNSVGSRREEVTKCYSEVQESLARKEKEHQTELAQQARREREHEKYREDREKDRALANKRAQTASAQHDVPVVRQEQPSASQPPPTPTAQTSIVVHESQAEQQVRLAAQAREENRRVRETLSKMIDPFSNSHRQKEVEGPASSADGGLIDPFTSTERKRDVVSEEVKLGTLDIENEFVETGIRHLESEVNRDLQAARKTLDPNSSIAYEQEVRYELSFIEGLGRLLEVWKYGADAGYIFVAKTQSERTKATDNLMTDAFKDGLRLVATKLSPRLVAILDGPVGWASATLSSSETGVEPQEVINDRSGRYDYIEKIASLQKLIIQYNANRTNRTWSYYRWLEQTANDLYRMSPDQNAKH